MSEHRADNPWGPEAMATGIVAVGLHLAGLVWAARVLLAVTALLWVVLAVVFGGLVAGGGARLREETSTPAALTAVAATGVLGDGAATISRPVAAAVLLGLAAVLWAVLLPRVLRRLGRRVPGSAFMLTVALGMTAVSAMTAGKTCDVPWLGTLGEVLLWPAVIVWAVVAAGAVRHAMASASD
ncbi:hypothetical protein AB0C21_10605 [Spirillospora sp. NPDC049024]